MRPRRWIWLVPLLLVLLPPLEAQRLYWDEPLSLESGGVRFPQAAAGGDIVVVVWQEFDDEGIFLSLRTSENLKEWSVLSRFAGPYFYQESGAVATPEPSIFSLDVDREGRIYIVVASEAEKLSLLYSEDGGESFSNSDIESSTTMISPRIFVRDYDRGLLLLAVQRSEAVEAQNIHFVSLDRSDFRRSRIRIEPEPLIAEENLVSNFLPYYAALNGKEYLAYQSQDAGEGYPNQIYLKISDDEGNFRLSDAPLPVTTYQADRDGQIVPFSEFENWRPYLRSLGDRLALAWERSFQGEPHQIYYAELAEDGSFLGEPETDSFGNPFGAYVQVSNAGYTSYFPQIFEYQGRIYLLWFDNRRGDEHIIVAENDEGRWRDVDISRKLEGSSIFPRVVQTEELFGLFWENKYNGVSRLYTTSLDRQVPSPQLTGGNFTAGRPTRSEEALIRWSTPSDPSGIAGYSYSWSREPDPEFELTLMLGGEATQARQAADADGDWYFHLAAQDFAGNWSAPGSIRFQRDRLPPPPVQLVAPETDEEGFQLSNDLALAWRPVTEDTVSGYTFQLIRLFDDPDRQMPAEPILLSPPSRVLTQQLQQNYRNVDNGVWAFSVAAIDLAGNIGTAESLLLRLKKYRPVTLIYRVATEFDDMGTLRFTINGRGFAAGGRVERVILDRDGEEPYDYVFLESDGQYTISGDRTINGPEITLFDEGVYRIGLEHSERGITYYGPAVALSPMGTVKWGDYSVGYVPQWQERKKPLFSLSINLLYAGVAVVFVVFAFIISVVKLFGVAREGQRLKREVMALLTGPISVERKEARMKEIERRGLGLRFKFVALITVLVVLIVLPLSVYFGFNLIQNQTENLADGLREKAGLMVGSMASGSVDSLLDNETLPLRNVADQKISMEEALHATITAVVPQGAETQPAEPGGRDYVWATNDPEIASEAGFVAGKYQLPADDLAPLLADLTTRVNEKAQSAVETSVQQLEENLAEFKSLILKTDEESQVRLAEIDEENSILQNQIRSELQRIASEEFGSVPEFNLQNLQEAYTFYVPITYRKAGEYFYYRGLIRLRVSAETIIRAISDTRRRLFVNSAIFALGAILLGILGALALTAITVNPIKKLVKGVALIRDTDDKEALKAHVIDIKQKDELRILADTVNEMTQGLVAAAIAAKDLTVGKEIQKMFIPLELDGRGQKATAGGEKTDRVEIFGYYEGAKGVSGDYFEYKKLDARHYAVIKCDVAGKGVPAALIMVEVATIFLTYFRNWTIKNPGLKVDGLAYMINDMLEERGFRGRFAALIIGIINIENGRCYFCNAGDNIVNLYDADQRRMIRKILPETPAAGVFPSMLLEAKSGFVTVPMQLDPADTLLLYTDGVFEAQRILRDVDYRPLSWQEVSGRGWDISSDRVGEATVVNAFEELSEERLEMLQNAFFSRGIFKLEKYRSPNPAEELVFDFGSCSGSVEEAVLAMIAVEKVFRIYPDPAVNAEDTITVDRRVDGFLKEHFLQYAEYFGHRVDKDPDSPYVTFGYLREDSQYDDLTILGIKRL